MSVSGGCGGNAGGDGGTPGRYPLSGPLVPGTGLASQHGEPTTHTQPLTHALAHLPTVPLAD